MANTLTGLQGQIYSAVNLVSREAVGFLPSVSINAQAARAALNDSVRVPVSDSTTGADISPSMNIATPSDKTVDYRNITITKSRRYSFAFTGEEVGGLNNGAGYASIQTQEIAQAIRGIVNEMEADVAAVADDASRAYGTAGTSPFTTSGTLENLAFARKVLKDNGAPVEGGFNCVIDTTAGAYLRSMNLFSKADEAGTMMYRDQGSFADLYGGRVRESGQVISHTKGTASGATTDTAGYSVGDTTITLASAGTGTILAGDVITFAGDSNKYVVKTGDSDVSGGGTIVLREPGLKVAIAASATAITVGDNYTGNLIFTPDAIQLAMRLPYLPEGGDAAVARFVVTDPFSGMVLEFCEYVGERKRRYDVAATWGVAMTKEEHACILLG